MCMYVYMFTFVLVQIFDNFTFVWVCVCVCLHVQGWCWMPPLIILYYKIETSSLKWSKFFFFIFFLFANRFFSHYNTRWPQFSLPSLFSTPLFLSPRFTRPLFPIRKKNRSPRDNNLKKYYKTMQKSSYWSWVRQPNRRQRVSRSSKRVRNRPIPTVRSVFKHPSNSYNTYS